jgi:hypothetical protein
LEKLLKLNNKMLKELIDKFYLEKEKEKRKKEKDRIRF